MPNRPVPRVRVVVVNWNSAWFTRRCLRSLLRTRYPADRLEVVLVDNGSVDDSLERLRRNFPEVRVVATGLNLGFAEGCNRALRDRRGVDHVALVNSDAVVDPGWLLPLVEVLEEDPTVGAVATQLVLEPGFVPLDVHTAGPEVVLDRVLVDGLDVTGRVHPEGLRAVPALDWPLRVGWHLGGEGRLWVPAPSRPVRVELRWLGGAEVEVTSPDGGRVTGTGSIEVGVGDRRTELANGLGSALNELGEGYDVGFGQPWVGDGGPPREVTGFCGGGVLLRGAMLDEVGLFDPAFFAYYEDTDLSWRARRAGWRIVAAPGAVVHHAFGGSIGSRGPGFYFLDRRNWILTNLRNADPAGRRRVVSTAAGSMRRAMRINVVGRLRRGRRPSWTLVVTWARVVAASVAAAPRAVRSRRRSRIGVRPTDRVRSRFQPVGSPAPPAHRPGGPRLVYVDVTDTLGSGWRAGIQRVVRGVVAALPEVDDRLEVVPIRWSEPDQRFRRLSGPEYRRLLDGPARTAPSPPGPGRAAGVRRALGGGLRAAGLDGPARTLRRRLDRASTGIDERALVLERLEPGAVLLELDAVWNRDEPDRVRLLAEAQASGVHVVVGVHDLFPFEHPEWFHPDLVPQFRRVVGAQLDRADLVLVFSEASAAAVRRRWGAAGADRPLAVVPLGTDDTVSSPRGRPELPERLRREPFVLSVGTVEPRKNLRVLLDAVDRLRSAPGADPGSLPTLVVVGRSGWRADDLGAELRRRSEAGAGVVWLQDADDATLSALLGSARLLLAPSRAEGFGLTAVEAVRAGVPVVGSPRAVPGAPAGAVARLVDADDVAGWADAIVELSPDGPLRDAALAATNAAEVPTWPQAAARWADVLVGRFGTP